ncbi:DUF4332 domain-containing protein [Mariniblastus fucicola]|uniref:Chromosome partition protein Smc n=1 Tax=Mariniblastus fucicola TaxID=980251 RepID=A0A5B9P7B5_9BACT|nr:DUF4332 domain-containing protein [Mariniblastus fucicola]QEG21085.1 Chromosome partition protein Smc [Mariniblastus fucicola]
MKLKELTVELSGNDNARVRSINIGPLTDGLNFIYGERGAGKSTIRNLVSDLLLDSCEPGAPQRTAVGCNSIGIVIECESGRYRITRDAAGTLNSTRIGTSNGSRLSYDSAHHAVQLNHDIADTMSFVAFRSSNQRQERLHSTLMNRFHVPLGPDAAMENQETPHLRQQRSDAHEQTELLRSELVRLQSQRASIESEPVQFSDIDSSELDRQVANLTTRLAELDPNRIRLEIDSLQQEASRLRLEISNANATTTEVVENQEPSRYLATLYLLLDEVEQQIREVRAIQSNVQRHRVRLKEEMEMRNSLTVDESNHPYHRAREILRQIEGRIDNADTRGDQWLEDHGTVDAQQVSRFLDETCRSVRDDLQSLCDELSNQYRELRNRSATIELKELRHNFTHLSELIQQILGRREAIVREIRIADPPGGEAIDRAAPDFCQLAVTSGHLMARQKFVGPVVDSAGLRKPVVTQDTSLQQQQLSALENRLASLQSSLGIADTESVKISREIEELNLRRASLSTLYLTQKHERIAHVDEQIRSTESRLLALAERLQQLPQRIAAPHTLLVTAGNILQHLTGGDYLHVWLSADRGVFEVRDRQLKSHRVDDIPERGLSQLVHLSLILAANESDPSLRTPLILDDLFADLQSTRIDRTLDSLSRWSRQNLQQVIVLTQHRFLSDRLPDVSVWEIEPESNSAHWRPATQETLSHIDGVAPTRVEEIQSWGQQEAEVYVGESVAEYPRSPLPRPYPLSKYPRTSDRDRSGELEQFEQYEVFAPHEFSTRVVASSQIGSVPIDPIRKAAVVSPSVVGDPLNVASINESTRIDSISLFDSVQLRCLSDCNVNTVGEFLMLDSEMDDAEFVACYLTGESLEHLQASAWLMSWVPGLSANDAQALVACGILDPEHLLTSNIDTLFERVSRFLRSPDGRRFGSSNRSLDRETVQTWQERLRNNRNYRHQSRPRSSSRRSGVRRHALRAWSPGDRSNSRSNERAYSDQSDRERSPIRKTNEREAMPARSPRMRTPEPREPRKPVPPLAPRERRSPRKPDAVRHSSGRQSLTARDNARSAVASDSRNSRDGNTASRASETDSSKSSKTTDSPKLRFYLDLTDHIEAAPSIGPKTGSRFEAIGVHTIADFLKITAESLAEKLNYKRLSAKVIRQYQNQTRLVCRIPNLRGHDAQLLVGCGIFEAEELASMRPETLFAKIAPFSDTKEGLKIIRNGKKPDLAEVTDWISFAQHNRSLQAA